MWSERIYDSLPIALQSAAVSLRGWQYHRARYLSPSFKETARVLERNEELSSEVLNELQFCMFRDFAAHAYEHSPYYRKLWDSQRLHPDDIRNPSDIRLVPIVPKQDLRARTSEFFTQKINRKMTPAHTSGTTGSPLTVYFSKDDIGRRHAFLDRCRRWAGVSIGQRRATFTGRNIIPQSQQAPPFWRYNYSGKQLLFSAYHLSPQNLSAYVQALEDFQSQIIDGYPSAIHIVADHILRDPRVRSINPRAILVSAETVLPRQRATIETAFATRLYNQYASSEGAPFVSECRSGRLHVHSDSGLVEILDSDNNPAAPGQMGQMVVTSFTTHVAPLVRFAIGDIAIQSRNEEPCRCGLPFPTIDAIVGREDDVLFTPDRGFVGRLDTVFKSVANTIIEAQIVQTSPEKIILRVVPDRARYASRDADKIVEEMRKRLGQIVRIDVEEVQSIPRSANGKMRPVVNLCQDLLPAHLRYNSHAETSSQVEQVPTVVS
jgi:phenylacetate-CoA ligase